MRQGTTMKMKIKNNLIDNHLRYCCLKNFFCLPLLSLSQGANVVSVLFTKGVNAFHSLSLSHSFSHFISSPGTHSLVRYCRMSYQIKVFSVAKFLLCTTINSEQRIPVNWQLNGFFYIKNFSLHCCCCN